MCRIKADPIITYFQQNPISVHKHAQVHFVRASVLGRVMQRLLRNTVQFLFDLEWQIRLVAKFCLNLDFMPRV